MKRPQAGADHERYESLDGVEGSPQVLVEHDRKVGSGYFEQGFPAGPAADGVNQNVHTAKALLHLGSGLPGGLRAAKVECAKPGGGGKVERSG